MTRPMAAAYAAVEEIRLVDAIGNLTAAARLMADHVAEMRGDRWCVVHMREAICAVEQAMRPLLAGAPRDPPMNNPEDSTNA